LSRYEALGASFAVAEQHTTLDSRPWLFQRRHDDARIGRQVEPGQKLLFATPLRREREKLSVVNMGNTPDTSSPSQRDSHRTITRPGQWSLPPITPTTRIAVFGVDAFFAAKVDI